MMGMARHEVKKTIWDTTSMIRQDGGDGKWIAFGASKPHIEQIAAVIRNSFYVGGRAGKLEDNGAPELRSRQCDGSPVTANLRQLKGSLRWLRPNTSVNGKTVDEYPGGKFVWKFEYRSGRRH
jgi:hypothetical protein